MKTYKDIPYIVYFFEQVGHYCAYVRLPDEYKDKEKLDKTREAYGRKHFVGYDDIDLKCHGGLTFGRKVEKDEKTNQGFTEGYWVGWDYGHYGDYMKIGDTEYDGVYHTEESVERDCKDVIDQILPPPLNNL